MHVHAKDNSTVHRLMRAFMLFDRTSWHDRSGLGPKPSEVKLLICLRRAKRSGQDAMTVTDISKRLHVTSPTVTGLINSLEREGLVQRRNDAEDRRSVCVSLTQKGEDVTQTAVDAITASLDGLIAHLGEQESIQLAELLLKVFHYFEASHDGAEAGPP